MKPPKTWASTGGSFRAPGEGGASAGRRGRPARCGLSGGLCPPPGSSGQPQSSADDARSPQTVTGCSPFPPSLPPPGAPPPARLAHGPRPAGPRPAVPRPAGPRPVGTLEGPTCEQRARHRGRGAPAFPRGQGLRGPWTHGSAGCPLAAALDRRRDAWPATSPGSSNTGGTTCRPKRTTRRGHDTNAVARVTSGTGVPGSRSGDT